jgi:hypothetical protein
MITATVSIETLTGTQDFTVEIINVFTTGDGRKIATVEALPIDGKEIRPFTQYTHGGPCQSSDARIPVAALKNIAIAVELPVTLVVEVGSL